MVKEQMQAVILREPGGRPEAASVPVPEPGPGEVLVRMHAAPVNPSDLALIRENYMPRDYPFVPGLEGSGRVVKAGSGLLPRLRKGKQVACTPGPRGNGTWAEYMVTSAEKTVPLPAGITPEQGSMMLINPMTAMAFLYLAKGGGHRAVVNTAAASALGKMLIRLGQRYHIPLINIVRKDSHVDVLKEMGAFHVLNSESGNFAEELRRLSSDLKATLILDAVSGKFARILLGAAPVGSTLVEYARLSGDALEADPADLMRGQKTIRGFLLGNWLDSKSTVFKLRFIRKVKKQISSTLATGIRRTFPLDEAGQAIDTYQKQMSPGKILLVPGK